MATGKWTAAIAALALAAGNGSGAATTRPAPAKTAVTDAMIAAGRSDERLSCGGGYNEQRFNPLVRISDKVYHGAPDTQSP